MKRALILLLIATLSLVSGCSNKGEEVTLLGDSYRNYYEIFVGSFYDSDENGIGDIKGLIEKLDYLNEVDGKTDKDLGIDGIWLMPIMPSPTYHKYDVKDYCAIDPQYGTMEDFEEFIKLCDERGINVIIDLVLNHTSAEHPWFVAAKKSLAIEPCGQEKCTYEDLCREHSSYVKYYNFSQEKLSGYHSVGMPKGWYYEGVFWDQMPDLNLDNEDAWNEIEEIGKFWIDKGVAGFRLDAVTSYYTGNVTKNVEALNRFNTLMKDYKDDIYIFGEAWSDAGSIASYYESGVDSFFNFPYGDSNGILVNTIRNKTGHSFAKKLEQWQDTLERVNEEAIDAPFLSNHDMGRSAGYLMRDLAKEKMAASLYLMMPGNSFIYYGEEIGMTGSGIDENKRLPMVWSVEDKSGITYSPLGATADNSNILAGVSEQEKDESSLLNFYKKAIKLKNMNPEIARGDITAIDVGNGSICAYSCEYEGSKVYVIHNLSEEEVKIDFSKEQYKYSELRGNLIAIDGEVTLKGDSLTLPSMSTAIVK